MDNINLQTKKFFLYARKSTDEPERQILSIEAQLFELREYARKEGLTLVHEFVESKTAKEPGREIFNEMVASIEKNEAEGILAWHPDRLARNSIDGGRIIYLVDTGKISALKFPTFWFDPTPHGKFMLSIAFGQSKYYVDNLSENIRRGIRQKLRNGIWPAWAPLGYVNDKNARNIVVDKEKAKYIKRAFEMYATGEYPLAQKARNELVDIETKLDRLLDLQLSGGLSQAEYAAKKHKLILAKKDFQEKIHSFERKSNNRFELAIAFLKEANQAENIAIQENPIAERDFLKKIGSNFRIAERTLACDFENLWKIAEKYHAEARSAEATSYDFAKSENWRRG